MQRNGLNELTNNVVGRPAELKRTESSEVSTRFQGLNDTFDEFAGIMVGITDLVFVPRPAELGETRDELGEIATVSQRLGDVYYRLNALKCIAAEILCALREQLDSKTRLV